MFQTPNEDHVPPYQSHTPVPPPYTPTPPQNVVFTGHQPQPFQQPISFQQQTGVLPTQGQFVPTQLPTPPYQDATGYPPEKGHYNGQPLPDANMQQQQQFHGYPPEKMQQLKLQINAPSGQVWAPPPALPYTPPTPGGSSTPGGKLKDQHTSGRVKRLLGDSMVGRLTRASVQTVSSALKMPEALSPWGDNNPVTLPNVRYRDAILVTACHFVATPLTDGLTGGVESLFGADAFISEIIGSTAGHAVAHMAVFFVLKTAIEHGANAVLPEEEQILTTNNVKSMRVEIKHKLMGVDADLRFWGVYPSIDPKNCAKGWFCPYLFASARTPMVPRANEFAIAQCFGPFLAADYAMAHRLVAESTHVLGLCDADPSHDIGTNRMVITFVGISPYRGGSSMWSTSRRPGCGTMHFHLFDGCPALVLPVNAAAPLLAWSPWTLAQMLSGQHAAEVQHEQLCEWLDSLVSMQHVNVDVRERFIDIMGRAVSLVINGALCLDSASKAIMGKVDPERAGIVMFRY